MRRFARFIHTHQEDNQLPTTWTYPQAPEREGAQVVSITQAVRMIVRGEDNRDDWWTPGTYPSVAILETTGASGDRGGLPYAVVLQEEVVSMKVIDCGELHNELLMESMERECDIDDLLDEIEEGVFDHLFETVTPEWIHTLEAA